jgi:formylglycine-generating enzyme required for sulfatase activity
MGMRWIGSISLIVLPMLCLLGLRFEAVSGDNPPAPLAMKAYTDAIADSDVKFDMVPIPGGTFTLGSPDSEKDRGPDEGPQRKVLIHPFWMGKREVTWDEFDLFAESAILKDETEKLKDRKLELDGITRPTPPYTDMTFGFGKQGYPAICMTHHAAVEYCRWLSAKTGKHYRLPTEAEWEYACRAGTTTAYSFGDDPSQLGDYAWHLENADGKPHPVGRKKPNPWGLLDIHGNVAEWCLDHYLKDAYTRLPADMPAVSPVILPSDRRFPHPVRGGSWDDEAPGCRSAARKASHREWLKQDPQRPQSVWWLTEGQFVGFRVIRPLVEQANLKGFKSKVTKESRYNWEGPGG